MDQGELEGMPEPAVLRLVTSDGQVLVTWGHTLVYRYEVEDIGMRNLAIVALTDAGRRVDEAAGLRLDRDVRVDAAGAGPLKRHRRGWYGAVAGHPSSVNARSPRPAHGRDRAGPSRRSPNAWGVLAR